MLVKNSVSTHDIIHHAMLTRVMIGALWDEPIEKSECCCYRPHTYGHTFSFPTITNLVVASQRCCIVRSWTGKRFGLSVWLYKWMSRLQIRALEHTTPKLGWRCSADFRLVVLMTDTCASNLNFHKELLQASQQLATTLLHMLQRDTEPHH